MIRKPHPPKQRTNNSRCLSLPAAFSRQTLTVGNELRLSPLVVPRAQASVGGAVLAWARYFVPALALNLLATLVFWVPSFVGNLLFCEEKPSARVWISFAFYAGYYALFRVAKAKYEKYAREKKQQAARAADDSGRINSDGADAAEPGVELASPPVVWA